MLGSFISRKFSPKDVQLCAFRASAVTLLVILQLTLQLSVDVT